MRIPFSRIIPKNNSDEWHKQIKQSNVGYTLREGWDLDLAAVDHLRLSTDVCIARWRRSLPNNPSEDELDRKLAALVQEHGAKENGQQDVAIFACLHLFSSTAATTHLLSIASVDTTRYLRCIAAASAVTQGVVSDSECRASQVLVRLLTRFQVPTCEVTDVSAFHVLLQTLDSLQMSTLLPPPFIDGVLTASNFGPRLQTQLDTFFGERRLRSAFELVSWLLLLHSPSDPSPVFSTLNSHFPKWTTYSTWRPNFHRISRWEEQRSLTAAQRQKLERYFDLEGPDTTGKRLATLRLSEPDCYLHIQLEVPDAANLNRLLNNLDRAIDSGPKALDLFMLLCVDRVADEQAIVMVEEGVSFGNDSCSGIISLRKALESDLDTFQKLQAFATSLPLLRSSVTTDDVLIERIANALPPLMMEGQAEFCQRMQRNAGESFGILLHKFGSATMRCAWLQPSLPPSLISKLEQLPSQETMEAIFRRMETSYDPYGQDQTPQDSRLKTYLLNSLGGQGSVDAATLRAVREELKFWEERPDTDRIELEKVISNVEAVGHNLYVSCLHQMLKETDLVIRDLTTRIRTAGQGSCPGLARYLCGRLEMRQSVHQCWRSLLVCLIKERGAQFLSQLSDILTTDQWLQFTKDIRLLVDIDNTELADAGVGLSRELIQWWNDLSHRYEQAVQFISDFHGPDVKLNWLFIDPSEDVKSLVRLCREPARLDKFSRQVISYLRTDGSNVPQVCNCVAAVLGTTERGRAICARMVSRYGQGAGAWSANSLGALLEVLHREEGLRQVEKRALRATCEVMGIHPRAGSDALLYTGQHLSIEFDSLIESARSLETVRARLHRNDPGRTATLSGTIGIEDTPGSRLSDPDVPDALIDAVETVGDREYEVCFALTGLSDLQRKARGVPLASRAVVVRFSLNSPRPFCIHLANETMPETHRAWNLDRGGSRRAFCNTKPNLFTYVLGRNVHGVLARGDPSVQAVYDSIANLIKQPPTTCFVCFSSLGVKLWKPATCSPQCSIRLRQAPLEVRLHGLLVDPLTIDLLLTCLYAAAADPLPTFDLLSGCPVQKHMAAQVIDSFPPLAQLSSASDLASAIRGSDGLAKNREDLLSWLCLSFRGFMISAPTNHKIPSMPNTIQFLMPNSSHDREKAYAAHSGGVVGQVVFHGTQASRLLPILSDGLKVMSGTTFQLNGAASGVGVYCGDDPATSLGYAGSTGQSWRNSMLRNMRVMLGCEMAGYGTFRGYHVVNPDDRLIVRYVFLLPTAFQAPPRRHVDQAFSTAFAGLRSGM
jgi:hypothetical protein